MGQAWSWERFGADLAATVLSGGEFSRAELVRSFQRRPAGEVMPEVYEIESRSTPFERRQHNSKK